MALNLESMKLAVTRLELLLPFPRLQRQFIEQAGYAGMSPERLGQLQKLDYMQNQNQ